MQKSDLQHSSKATPEGGLQEDIRAPIALLHYGNPLLLYM